MPTFFASTSTFSLKFLKRLKTQPWKVSLGGGSGSPSSFSFGWLRKYSMNRRTSPVLGSRSAEYTSKLLLVFSSAPRLPSPSWAQARADYPQAVRAWAHLVRIRFTACNGNLGMARIAWRLQVSKEDDVFRKHGVGSQASHLQVGRFQTNAKD